LLAAAQAAPGLVGVEVQADIEQRQDLLLLQARQSLSQLAVVALPLQQPVLEHQVKVIVVPILYSQQSLQSAVVAAVVIP
jgi:hypothetical protein